MGLDYEDLKPLAIFTATIGVCSHYYRTPPQLEYMYLSICTILQAENKPPIRTSQRQDAKIPLGTAQQQTENASIHVKNFFFSRDSAAGSRLEISSIATAIYLFIFFGRGEQALLASGFCSLPFFDHRKIEKWYVALHFVSAWKELW